MPQRPARQDQCLGSRFGRQLQILQARCGHLLESLLLIDRHEHRRRDASFRDGSRSRLGRPRAHATTPKTSGEMSEGNSGAGDEIRTHDFNLGKVALYP